MNGPAGGGVGDDSDQEKSALKGVISAGVFASMGLTIASCVAAGLLLGLYADHLFHSAPWGLLIGIVLGTVAAVASVVSLVRRFL